MARKRVGRHLSGGQVPDEERERRERTESLREAWAHWVTGVTIVAVRDGDAVHAVTVSAFLPLSAEPPLVAISLGSGASVLPFLDPDTPFTVSILTADQKGLASRYADTFPVGPSPFRSSGDPVVEGCLAWVTSRVEELLPRGDHTLVIGRVVEAMTAEPDAALAYYRRDYHRVD